MSVAASLLSLLGQEHAAVLEEIRERDVVARHEGVLEQRLELLRRLRSPWHGATVASARRGVSTTDLACPRVVDDLASAR
jgi:hypothetical protein